MMENVNTEVKRGGLFQALKEALSNDTEKERILGVLNCIRGYKTEYNKDSDEEKDKFEGFMKCKSEFKGQIQKVKDYVEKHDF